MVLISYVLTAIIVAVTYRSAKSYRDNKSGGYINYATVFNYVVLSFLFASFISSIFKIIYTQFINPEYLAILFQESMRQIEQNRSIFDKLGVPLDDNYFETLESQMKPVNYALQTIWMNVFSGALLGLIIAAIVKKKKGLFDESGLTELQENK